MKRPTHRGRSSTPATADGGGTDDAETPSLDQYHLGQRRRGRRSTTRQSTNEPHSILYPGRARRHRGCRRKHLTRRRRPSQKANCDRHRGPRPGAGTDPSSKVKLDCALSSWAASRSGSFCLVEGRNGPFVGMPGRKSATTSSWTSSNCPTAPPYPASATRSSRHQQPDAGGRPDDRPTVLYIAAIYRGTFAAAPATQRGRATTGSRPRRADQRSSS